jgi:hypothetical protein
MNNSFRKDWNCAHGVPHKQCGFCYDQKEPQFVDGLGGRFQLPYADSLIDRLFEAATGVGPDGELAVYWADLKEIITTMGAPVVPEARDGFESHALPLQSREIPVLLPCPFCGEAPELIIKKGVEVLGGLGKNKEAPFRYIHCEPCGFGGSYTWWQDRATREPVMSVDVEAGARAVMFKQPGMQLNAGELIELGVQFAKAWGLKYVG